MDGCARVRVHVCVCVFMCDCVCVCVCLPVYRLVLPCCLSWTGDGGACIDTLVTNGVTLGSGSVHS